MSSLMAAAQQQFGLCTLPHRDHHGQFATISPVLSIACHQLPSLSSPITLYMSPCCHPLHRAILLILSSSPLSPPSTGHCCWHVALTINITVHVLSLLPSACHFCSAIVSLVEGAQQHWLHALHHHHAIIAQAWVQRMWVGHYELGVWCRLGHVGHGVEVHCVDWTCWTWCMGWRIGCGVCWWSWWLIVIVEDMVEWVSCMGMVEVVIVLAVPEHERGQSKWDMHLWSNVIIICFDGFQLIGLVVLV